MSDNKINYFGTVYYNEYEGNFTGYTLILTEAQLEEAKEFLGENGRVRFNIRNGKLDPKKPYSTIAPDKSKAGAAPAQQQKQYSKPQAATNDLPF